MKGWLLGAVLVMACLSAVQVAHAKPHHEGFTGDLGIGASLMLVPHHTFTDCTSSDPSFCAGVDTGPKTEHTAEFGLAPLSLSLGGYITPQFALLARLAGTSYFKGDNQIGHNFYGVIGEWWPADRFYLSGGVGFAIYGPNPFLGSSSRDPKYGWALDVRAGVALAQGTNHDFTLSLEAIPGFYEDDVVTGFGLVGAWKWY
jgi:hypothetical protein